MYSKNDIFGIYGMSGFGREVLPLIKEEISIFGGNPENIYFIDDAVSNEEKILVNKHKVLSFKSFIEYKSDNKYIAIAIANSKIREKLTNKCIENNINLFNVIANNVIKMDEVTIGSGSILCPFVTLTSNIQIGESFHANLYSYVAHDCKIGDYVTFAPGVKCNGNVEIGDYAYIGTGAIIQQGKPGKPLKIGKNAIVGAGAVVTKNVPEGMTVFGNPAIELTKTNLKKRM